MLAIWQTYDPVTTLNNQSQFTKSFFPLISFSQPSSIKHSCFYVVSFSLENFINFFKMSCHMDKLLKNLQSKCFWFQHTVCSVGTNCEIGSWVYDSSMHLWKISPSRHIFKALIIRVGHGLFYEFERKTVLSLEHRKTKSGFVTSETQTGYQPGGRSAVWVWSMGSSWGPWNLCVF